MTWLCGDVGGTNARLAAFDGGLHAERTSPSSSALELATILERWLSETGVRPRGACLALAGPVHENRCVATNLPWVVDGAELGARLGFPVRIINDFHAAALGILRLSTGDRVQIGGGPPAPGPIAVLGAGTGLGEALLLPGGLVVPGEGGHAEFGPTNERELRLARWLFEREGRASWEHVLSGPGLVRLAAFAAEDSGTTPPPWLADDDAPRRVATELPAVATWFAELYGIAAGNAALRTLPRGGVWLCGGIAPTLLPLLQAGGFRRRFEAKGKVSPAIATLPAFVVTHRSLGLLGAAEALERGEAR
jgi:glucokinase